MITIKKMEIMMKKMKIIMGQSNIIYIFIVSFLLICLFNYKVYGDTIEFPNGSVMVGKIIEEEDIYYLLANTRGVFKVKKQVVKNVHETKSYEEDVDLLNRLGNGLPEKSIKRNYLAGERTLALRKDKIYKNKADDEENLYLNYKKKKGKYSDEWDFGRIHLSTTYFFTIGTIPGKILVPDEVLPTGFSGQLAYEQGFDMLYQRSLKKSRELMEEEDKKNQMKVRGRPWFLPGLRMELSYMYFTKEIFVNKSKEVSGFTLAIGAMWIFPSPLHYWGCIILAIQPGYTFLDVYNRETREEGKCFSMMFTSILGYEYAIKRWVSIALHLRYTYIHDPQVAFHSIGLSFGLSIRLW